ncbi:hypothetical protein [Brevundimonas sp. FT23028]|uniref:hypothetical protein n=1 Tax=Brevundimonas sp. FT23028 TaxID=3393748 RepID=UPI003B587015
MHHRPQGPDKPPALITLQSARRHDMALRIGCDFCGRWRKVRGADLPEQLRAVSLGELWLCGRFRCSGCGRPATSLEVTESELAGCRKEKWALGEAFTAERLRRHWRWDPYDRRDWHAWFRRT